MPMKGRDPNPSGLGRAIINRKVKDARRAEQSGLYSVDLDTTNRLKSVTQEKGLDEFLNTAQLAGTEFTAERRNVKVIQQSASATQNPYLLSEQEEKKVVQKQLDNKQRLQVPRRPPWVKSMSAQELDRQEKDSFLEWRRKLAELQDRDQFLLTPFERNLEVWRQLWRVLERSQLVVQIVDARNPLRFRCEDLDDYVLQVEGTEGEAGTGKNKRKSMLLINKADLLTQEQRVKWADYFDTQNITYAFYSAANAAALQEARRELAEFNETNGLENDSEEEDDDEESEQEEETPGKATVKDDDDSSEDEDGAYYSADDEEPEEVDPRAKILSVNELEERFMQFAPDLKEFSDASGNAPTKLVVGLVGYPNVGKSSTINSLLGEKKVSVSSTPGKTKHFQTINLSDTITLCDCPGLVFPQFANTKADLVCDGVLPIDQLREYTAPVALLTKRLPKEILETTYGLNIKTVGVEEGGDSSVTPENFLIAYAIARGYTRSGQGNPDEARAARYILKDYVNGKLLFCHPPPGITDAAFNEISYKNALKRYEGKKTAPTTRVGKDSDTFVPAALSSSILPAQGQGQKSGIVDKAFFEQNSGLQAKAFLQADGASYARSHFYPHQNAVGNDGVPLDPTQARMLALLEARGGGGKKHKKAKRAKQRSGKGYD